MLEQHDKEYMENMLKEQITKPINKRIDGVEKKVEKLDTKVGHINDAQIRFETTLNENVMKKDACASAQRKCRGELYKEVNKLKNNKRKTAGILVIASAIGVGIGAAIGALLKVLKIT